MFEGPTTFSSRGLALLASLVLTPGPSAAPTRTEALPSGYRLYQTIALFETSDGMIGALEILQDDRVTEDRRQEIGGATAESVCDDAADPLCDSIKARPIAPAVVRLVDGRGRVVDSRTFERALATIEVRDLYGGRRRAFSVTVDFGIGWGSYAGPRSYFLDVAGRRLNWLVAERRSDGKRVEVAVMFSLKTGWRLVPSGSEPARDILEFACRPTFSESKPVEVDFELIYRRYHLRGHHWYLSERREPGFWEHDREFPSAELFPR